MQISLKNQGSILDVRFFSPNKIKTKITKSSTVWIYLAFIVTAALYMVTPGLNLMMMKMKSMNVYKFLSGNVRIHRQRTQLSRQSLKSLRCTLDHHIIMIWCDLRCLRIISLKMQWNFKLQSELLSEIMQIDFILVITNNQFTNQIIIKKAQMDLSFLMV